MSGRSSHGPVLVLLLGASCAVPTNDGFGEVQADVDRRIGKRVEWHGHSATDAEVQAAVNELLQRELTADAAVQVALLNNRELQATLSELGVALADLVQAGLLRNPVFDAEARFESGGSGIGLELALTQDFLGILFLPLRKRVAAAAFAAAKARLTADVLATAAEARTAFYEVQAAEQVLELRQSVSAATGASAALAERLREAGNIRELDLATERALHEHARLDVAAAELDAIDAREQLSVLMGLWSADTPWTASRRLPDPPTQTEVPEQAQSRAVEASLLLAARRHEIEQVAARLGLDRIEQALPDGDIGAAAEREVDGTWSVGPALTLAIPLFDQGQAAARRAAAELRRLQQTYAAEAVAVRAAVRRVIARSLAAAQRVAHYRDVVLPLQRQIVEQTQLQYNAMQVGAFQLLLAKQQEIDAGIGYIEALRDYWTARVAVEQLAAGSQPNADRGASSRGGDERPESTLTGAGGVR